MELEVEGTADSVRVVHVFQSSPLRVLFPERGRCRTKRGVIVNTAGGVAGGDHLRVNVSARSGASVALTTQTAERIYRTLGDPAIIDTRLCVDGASAVAWLPQETIVFNGARMRRTTTLDLSATSEALVLESLVLGRLASGEVLDHGEIVESWAVWIEGRLAWADRLNIDDALLGDIGRNALFGDNRAVATLVYVGAEVEARILDIRGQPTVPGTHCLVTQVGKVMITRVAAADPRGVRQALKQILRPFNPSGETVFQTPRLWP